MTGFSHSIASYVFVYDAQRHIARYRAILWHARPDPALSQYCNILSSKVFHHISISLTFYYYYYFF